MPELIPTPPQVPEAVTHAEAVVHDAWRQGEGAALEAQEIVDTARTRDPEISVLEQLRDVAESSQDVPHLEGDTIGHPLEQAEQALRRSPATDFLSEIAMRPVDVPQLPNKEGFDRAIAERARSAQEALPAASSEAVDETTATRERLLRGQQGLGPRHAAKDFLRPS